MTASIKTMNLALQFGINLFLLAKLSDARTWAGNWKGDYGPIVLFEGKVLPRGKVDVIGGYANGVIKGVATRHRFTGIAFLLKGRSNKRCATPQHGSFYWARVEWTKVGSDTFFGYWGHCSETPSIKWNGIRNSARTGNFVDKPFRFTGKWKTTYGNWYAESRSPNTPNLIWGPYGVFHGYVDGTQTGRVLKGTWVENRGNKKCRKKVRGSFYWGRVNFFMKKNLREFTGKWGYCNDALDTKWVGSRVK